MNAGGNYNRPKVEHAALVRCKTSFELCHADKEVEENLAVSVNIPKQGQPRGNLRKQRVRRD